MNSRFELDAREDRGVDVNQLETRMARHQVATALGAPFPVAVLCFVEFNNVLLAHNDLDLLRLPEGERVDRPGRPMTTAVAVTISHAGGLAGDFDFNGAAKALTLVYFRHDFAPLL